MEKVEGNSFIDGTIEARPKKDENNHKKSEKMNLEEWNLWNELDIKGYGSKIFALGYNFRALIELVESGEKSEAESTVLAIEDICREFSKRIGKIDLAHFDTRFPLDIIRNLTENGSTVLHDLVGLARRTINQGVVNNNQKEEIKNNLHFFTQLRDQSMEVDRFGDYTRSTTTEDRW